MADLDPSVERWRPVVGYRGYYDVSDQGRVRSLRRIVTRSDGVIIGRGETILKGGGSGTRYPVVVLSVNGVEVMRTIHRLVLEAFVGPCPDGMVACHYDDDPTNNHLSNLRWDTESANQLDKVRNGNHHAARKTHCKYGHEFTLENTQWIKGRHRRCRECARRRNREYGARVAAREGSVTAGSVPGTMPDD